MADVPVSAPVTWDELTQVEPNDFTLDTVQERIAKIGDPHASIDDVHHDITLLLEWSERDEASRPVRGCPPLQLRIGAVQHELAQAELAHRFGLDEYGAGDPMLCTPAAEFCGRVSLPLFVVAEQIQSIGTSRECSDAWQRQQRLRPVHYLAQQEIATRQPVILGRRLAIGLPFSESLQRTRDVQPMDQRSPGCPIAGHLDLLGGPR